MREVARKLGGVSVVLAWWLCALLISACLENPAVTCKNGLICAPGNVCDDAHGGCATSSQIVACTGKAAEAACSYPGVSEGACYEGVCLPSGCGNGVMASDEVCDDGNRIHGDECSADCRSTEACGNGVIDEITSEQCDDGNLVDGDGCQSTCRSPRCGDGVVDNLSRDDVRRRTSKDRARRRQPDVDLGWNGVGERHARIEQPDHGLADDRVQQAGGACEGTCLDLDPDHLVVVVPAAHRVTPRRRRALRHRRSARR